MLRVTMIVTHLNYQFSEQELLAVRGKLPIESIVQNQNFDTN